MGRPVRARRHPTLLLAALLLLGVVAAACAAPPTASRAAPPAAAPAAATLGEPAPAAHAATAAPQQAPLTTVRFAGQASTLSDAGLYLADAQGYFREQGIALDRQVLAPPEAVPALASGQIEVSAVAPNAGLFNAIGRGIPLKIVADKGRAGPGFAFQSMVVRPELVDSGALQEVRDLRGRRLAVPSTGTPLEASLVARLAAYDLSLADLQTEILAFPDMAPALANGSVDAVLIIEPLATQIANRGIGTIWNPHGELRFDQQIAVITFGPAFAAAPDLARRWMVAYVRGLRLYDDAFLKGDPAARAAVIPVLAANTQVAPELIEQIAAGRRLPGLDPDGRVDADALRSASAYWREQGLQTVDVDVDQLVANEYVDYAVGALGPYR